MAVSYVRTDADSVSDFGRPGGCKLVRKSLAPPSPPGQSATVGRHVSAAGSPIADLVDELSGRQARADHVKSGPRFTAAPLESVTVAAVFVLEDHGALKLSVLLSTMSSRIGSPLQADICGDHGAVAPWYVKGGEHGKSTATPQDGTGRRAGGAFRRDWTRNGTRNRAMIKSTEHEDDECFGSGGLSDKKAEQPEKWPLGPRVGATRVGSGGASGPLVRPVRREDDRR